MPYMYSEMQNKLSKTRDSQLESMGQLISSRCPRSAGQPVFRYTSVTRATPLQFSICSIQTNGEPLTVFVSGL